MVFVSCLPLSLYLALAIENRVGPKNHLHAYKRCWNNAFKASVYRCFQSHIFHSKGYLVGNLTSLSRLSHSDLKNKWSLKSINTSKLCMSTRIRKKIPRDVWMVFATLKCFLHMKCKLKKATINLLCVSLKYYLRGQNGFIFLFRFE